MSARERSVDISTLVDGNASRSVDVSRRSEALSPRELPVTTTPAMSACCAPLAREVLGPADAETLSRQFAALADPVRLQLLSLLATASGGAVCACDLVEPVGKSQPTVSHHLKVLSDAGLVIHERRGRNVWYGVVPAALEGLRT